MIISVSTKGALTIRIEFIQVENSHSLLSRTSWPVQQIWNRMNLLPSIEIEFVMLQKYWSSICSWCFFIHESPRTMQMPETTPFNPSCPHNWLSLRLSLQPLPTLLAADNKTDASYLEFKIGFAKIKNATKKRIDDFWFHWSTGGSMSFPFQFLYGWDIRKRHFRWWWPRLSFFMLASIAGVSSSSSLTILPKYLNVLTLLIASPPTLKTTLLDSCSSRCLRYRWYLGVSVLHSFVLRCFSVPWPNPVALVIAWYLPLTNSRGLEV